MSGGFEGRLYLPAFDHRESFQEGLFGVHGTPSAERAPKIGHSKKIAFERLRRATATGTPRGQAIGGWSARVPGRGCGSPVRGSSRREA